ncbi:MAG: hypothetical protein K2M03_03715 [Muribaculaceae bacterium]|nr:hypothetical protein [Muribaculaceae bacterium]
MIDFNSIAGTIISVITGGGCGWMLRSARRKANAEADAAQFDTLRLAMEQIKDLQQEMADKTEKIRQLNETILLNNDRCHKLEMQLLTTRCDHTSCINRRPPLPWLTTGSSSDTSENSHNSNNSHNTDTPQ